MALAFRWFSDGLFIVNALEAHSRLIGYRVVRIGSSTPAQVHRALRQYVSWENDHMARSISQHYVASPDLLHAAG
jgi:hypothetical protein